MAESSKKAKKRRIVNRLYENFTKFRQCLIVKLENVTSNQVQQTRLALRQQKKGDMVCGKNTVVKKAIDIRRVPLEENDPDFEFRKPLFTDIPQIEKLSTYCRGKVGFIFSDAPVFELKPLIEGNKIPAPAKVGIIAPIEVVIPPGPTGLDPSQISFFHTLNISTKIQKGQIEITKEFRVCEKGKKIGNSEAAILQKLNIKPFAFGMEILFVYDDGSILTPDVFNQNPDELLGKIRAAASAITAISLAIGEPNALSIPHMIVNGFKNIAAIALETGYPLKQLEGMKAGAPAPVGAGSAPTQVKQEAAKAVVVEEKKEEEEAVDIGDMFGGEDY
jgi:large subunit ribosomal protein LP0